MDAPPHTCLEDLIPLPKTEKDDEMVSASTQSQVITVSPDIWHHLTDTLGSYVYSQSVFPLSVF